MSRRSQRESWRMLTDYHERKPPRDYAIERALLSFVFLVAVVAVFAFVP